MTIGVLLLILSVTTVIAAPFLNRHPWVMARSKGRRERRILAERKMAARKSHPATRLPPRPRRRVLGHETYLLMPDEEDAFARIAEDLRGLEYQWITEALDGNREAREQ